MRAKTTTILGALQVYLKLAREYPNLISVVTEYSSDMLLTTKFTVFVQGQRKWVNDLKESNRIFKHRLRYNHTASCNREMYQSSKRVTRKMVRRLMALNPALRSLYNCMYQLHRGVKQHHETDCSYLHGALSGIVNIISKEAGVVSTIAMLKKKMYKQPSIPKLPQKRLK
ncbi:hypothetical protein VTP01DRAFT_1799 [Rhizomucor pusillus]|uniref:uncharacterized protein n=1 Tax=Rhizomucor pusillus TaxID=4840 RepID=UPI00374402EE